jgi:transcriptional regulator with XRE-family HTH domain
MTTLALKAGPAAKNTPPDLSINGEIAGRASSGGDRQKEWKKTPPDLSIVNLPPELPKITTVAALNRARREKHIRHADLCRRSGLDRDTWRLMRLGKTVPRAATLSRIAAAIDGAGAPAPLETIAGAHRMAMVFLARELFAQRYIKHDIEALLGQDFSAERPADALWLEAAQLRRYAIYVCAVLLQIKNVRLASAIGCSRQNVAQARAWVEERRDHAKLDALLDRCARLLHAGGL